MTPSDCRRTTQPTTRHSGALEWEREHQDTHIVPPVIVSDRAVFHAGRGDWNDTDDSSKLVAVGSEGAVDGLLVVGTEHGQVVAYG
ncbi:hypothetical protein [Natrialba sp. SSL1]|uniref:hypothetical protein n=1 Tax=Natrialba sp. SSL1 TaxID=1869245 RepID=UPI0008F96871|nr:hypothetical protein [Natrialba sp. SSL1]OIB55642.1 hypothetical protein BBD46_04915 [Natrialba sp. SSL1]